MDDSIIMAQLTDGRTVIGYHDVENNQILQPASIVGQQNGTSYGFGIAPIGYPLEADINKKGKISCNHVVYMYDNPIEELVKEYIAKLTGIIIAPSTTLNNNKLSIIKK